MCQSLTDHDGDQQSRDSLLLHLLDARFISRCHGFAHDRQGVDVSHRADGGGSHPGQPEQSRGATQNHDQQQVQVEPRTFDQLPLLLANNQAAAAGEIMRKKNIESSLGVYDGVHL